MKCLPVLVAILLLSACHVGSQKKEEGVISSIPPFKFLLLDSTTVFNTDQIPAGRPVIFIYFSPDCEHCQREMKTLVENMKSLTRIRFYLITPMAICETKSFCANYKLSNYENITVGRDFEFAFMNAFKPQLVPFLVVFDRKKQFWKLFKGETDIHSIIEAANI